MKMNQDFKASVMNAAGSAVAFYMTLIVIELITDGIKARTKKEISQELELTTGKAKVS